jgi:UPF0716 protein FxsA
MPLLLIALIVVPLAEIAVFIQVGGWIGLAPTLLAVVLTAVLGAVLLRRQGLHTVQEAQAKLNRQEAPIRELFDGLCLFAAGALLLTPGFLTDIVGFALLVPEIRLRIARLLWQRLVERGTAKAHTHRFDRGFDRSSGYGESFGQSGHGDAAKSNPRDAEGGPVIDAEFEEVEPGRTPPDRGSPSTPDRNRDEDGDANNDGEAPRRSKWGTRFGRS